MTNQNSAPNNSIRPDELQAQLSIGKDTYYDDLKHLGIKAQKDAEGKAYLTFEQAEQVRALRSYVIETGSRKGFVYQKVEHGINNSNSESSIVKSSEHSIKNSNHNSQEIAIATEPEIYLTEAETNPTNRVNQDDLIRTAQELAARNIAIPHLIATELASNMEFDDLPEDLQEKVRIAQDAANPKKHQPKLIAQTLLKQLRMQRVS